MQRFEMGEFERFCREQRGLVEHSLRAYRQDLKTFNHFLAEHTPDSPIDQELVLAYQRHLREEKQASPATIRRRMVTLRAYFAWRDERDAGFSSPFTGLALDLRVPQRLPRPLDRPTLTEVFRQAPRSAQIWSDTHETKEIGALKPDCTTSLVARLLIVTGLRIGEITHVQMRDVTSTGSHIRVMGKGSRERTVYVTNERLLGDFQRYLHLRNLTTSAHDFVFLNARGGRLTEAAFRKRLRRLSEALCIEPHITPHRFRHSAATLLIEEGVDIRLVQRLLGHASIATTEIYTKVSDRSLFQAIEHADTLAKVDS